MQELDERGRSAKLTTDTILRALKIDKDVKTFVLELPDKYREILGLYEKSNGLAILQSEASIKVAKFLTEMVKKEFTTPFYAVLSGAAWIPPERNIAVEIASGLRVAAPEKAYTPISPVDVSTWTTKIWSEHKELTLLEQIHCLSESASLMKEIGLQRKQAFLLYEVVKKLLELSAPNSGKAILQCLDIVCNLLGIGGHERTSGSSSQLLDDWLDDFENEDDLDQSSIQGTAYVKSSKIPRLKHGWPGLQIMALRECIQAAERDGDHRNTIVYTTRMLRQMHKFLPQSEQSQLSERLQAVVLKTGTDSRDDLSVKDSQSAVQSPALNSSITGVPILRRIQAIEYVFASKY